jgi:DNA-binding NarL/FixJ family response regulator
LAGHIAVMADNGRVTRVLVVDDHDLIRAGIAALLRAAPGVEVTGEAGTGAEAVRMAAVQHPDVILMDVRLPDLDGIEATRRILAGAPALPLAPRVIVLTTFDLDEYVYGALRAGAYGFLLKDTPPQRLLVALAAAAQGEMLFAPTVVRRLVESYTRPGKSPPRYERELAQLTTREREVLRLVGRGLSNREIATVLVITEATVKTHVNRMMTKLGLVSRAQAVVVAYEAGLVVPGQPD